MPLSKSSKTPSPSPVHQWTFDAIGTQWWIGIYEDINELQADRLQQIVDKRVEQFDKTYSRFRKDSLVTKISRRPGTYEFPLDSAELFALYRQLYDATEGRVTPLVGQLLSDAGYDADYSLRAGKLEAVPTWDDVMRFDDYTLATTWPVLLDFGAAGKGYLVDIICRLLQEQGIDNFCVDGSGDMRAFGLAEPLLVGMEHPADPGLAIGVARIQNRAICASAPNKRRWQQFHHIMDPTKLRSPKHIQAVWVVADTCALADGLTTALFFIQPQLLVNRFTFEYAVVYADSSTDYSANFPADIFTERTSV